MAQFMVNIWELEAPYAPGGDADYDAVMEAHAAFGRAVREAGGRVVAGEALQPLRSATFLRGEQVIDNPLPELKETLGGFYVIDVADEATARRLAAVCPAAYGFIELRPIWVLDSGSAGSDAGAERDA